MEEDGERVPENWVFFDDAKEGEQMGPGAFSSSSSYGKQLPFCSHGKPRNERLFGLVPLLPTNVHSLLVLFFVNETGSSRNSLLGFFYIHHDDFSAV